MCKIRYIEYVTKSDNYIIEFTNEGITDEINIERINVDSNIKKKIKVGDKVTVAGTRPGILPDIIFIENIKGENPMKKTSICRERPRESLEFEVFSIFCIFYIFCRFETG